MKNDDQLKKIVQKWNTRAASAEVAALAEAAGNVMTGLPPCYSTVPACAAVGSMKGIADLYLLVDDYHSAFGSRFQALMNRLLPPNVFYLELP